MGLALEEQQNEKDIVVESNGMKVIYADEIEQHISGMTLEYTSDGAREGFHFSGGDGSC